MFSQTKACKHKVATVGPFEKQLCPLPSKVVTARGAVPGEALGAKEHSAGPSLLRFSSWQTTVVPAGWSGSPDFLRRKECTGNRETVRAQLSGGATSSVTGGNVTSMSDGPQPLPLTHTRAPTTLGAHHGGNRETHTQQPAMAWPVTVLCRKYRAKEHCRHTW